MNPSLSHPQHAAVDLSIIIVNWNSKEYLRKCLASIVAETGRLRYEIIVIDSGSFDGCGEMLRKHFPQVRFIQSEQNLGFARANNEAFALSTGACVLFLNPDTEVLDRALERMYAELQRLPAAGAMGCKLLNSDRTLQTSCIQAFPTLLNQTLDSNLLRRWWPRAWLWGTAPLQRARDEPQEVEAISGACVMLRRSVFEKAGCFSEDYFMYGEDMDLSYQTRLAGFRNYCVPSAAVIHHGGGSAQLVASEFPVVMMRESVKRFLHRNRGAMHARMYQAAMGVAALVRLPLLRGVALVRAAAARDTLAVRASRRKWAAILRWSLKRSNRVAQGVPPAEWGKAGAQLSGCDRVTLPMSNRPLKES